MLCTVSQPLGQKDGRVTGTRWRTAACAAVALAALVYLLALAVGVESGSWNILGSLLVLPVLALLTVPIARRFVRRDREPDLGPLFAVAFVTKMMGAIMRYVVAYYLYKGSADATGYDLGGRELAPLYRRGDFSVHVAQIPGTGFIKVLTGLVYAVAGTSRLGGFFVFAWIGFVGLILFWRAFRIAVPAGDSRRYLLLVLFVPSLVFWPSSIGKEAWMMLVLGLCAYGVARCFERVRPARGLVALVAGMVGILLVRPQLGLIVLAGIILGLAFSTARRRSALAPVAWILGIVVLMIVGLVLVAQTQSFLGVPSLTQDSVATALSNVETRTGEGGSAFKPIVVHSPLDIPAATVTVLFRPLPIEAHNGPVLVASLEGLFLLGLCLTSVRRLRQTWSQSRVSPYVAYSLGFTFAFIVAFSSFSNFGILARERTQVLPALFVLLALPAAQRPTARRLVFRKPGVPSTRSTTPGEQRSP
jgi:hypothetical protein